MSRSTVENQGTIYYTYALRLRSRCGSQTRAPCLAAKLRHCRIFSILASLFRYGKLWM